MMYGVHTPRDAYRITQKSDRKKWLTFLISKRPAFVPTSSSFNSSVRFTIVAPHARATRLLSDLRKRRKAVIPAWKKDLDRKIS